MTISNRRAQTNPPAKIVALQLERAGFHVGYGNARFKALQIGKGPFVHIYLGNTQQAQMSAKALAVRAAILEILQEFYNNYHASIPGARLVVRSIGIYGDILITNQDSDIIDRCTPRTRSRMLRLHEREFDALARFLSGKESLLAKGAPS
jgi:hypothetical protein